MVENLSTIKKNYIEYINRIVLDKKISHSYLIELDNYDDDFQYVLSFVKMILCDVLYDQIDSNNSIVSLIDSLNYPDLVILEPDGNTFRKSQILDLMKEFQNSSLLGGKRIYIIKHAECFNSSSGSSLLKFLEEPEENIIAFLLTNNRYLVLDTILSRCQTLSIKEYQYTYLKDDASLNILSCFNNPNNFFIQYNFFINSIFIDKASFLSSIENIEKIFLCYLNFYYHISSIKIDDDILSILCNIPIEKIISYISIIENEKDVLNYNVNFKLFLDSFYSKIIMEVIS
ncbi:MAG: hypothetical protein IKE70_00930 [Bacilli bacterium]|nr:hypothetical protein [Bacilli bacterium]